MSVFNVGDVVAAQTQHAKNYRRKYKYHLCVCCSNNLYLFINSEWFKGSFEITHADLPSLPNASSYISCSQALRVSDVEMKRNGAKVIGHLGQDVLRALLRHIEDSEVMSEEDQGLVIAGLADDLL